MTDTSVTREQIPVHVYGGPTTLIEYGGLRIVTDPTFDPPGEYDTGIPGYDVRHIYSLVTLR